ncbi:MAG TPA: tRNA epoxyqueuosine(34) reductase QueG [Mariprofundaceae bacterium]|nr:tRNA epoxyqueuosine(34) reductase QueG [Mariprofundaceae bacterium]
MTQQTKDKIRELAKQHGFELCAFTRPHINSIDQEALDRWVDAKMFGEMDYMGEKVRTMRRKQPATMLDGIQSVISLGFPYAAPDYEKVTPQQGIIASYARGDDYHELMKKKLKALARDLDVLLGEHGQRVYVDTAPVLEHALAAKGGLAWQGKHSLSINRDYGSWFFLAELFTTADIKPDTEATLHCGTCTDCMPACPTGAIVSPYVVDARLCISYLTIEFNGFIPENLRKPMGDRIFGCDDCQTICPWNQKAKKPEIDYLKPREDTFLPNLAMLLRLDDDDFRQMFRKSAIKRSKRAGLLRNVCIAMGNSGDMIFVPQLLDVLHDNEPLIRGHAVWALAQLAADDADVQQQIQLLKDNEQHKNVLAEIASFERVI